MTASRRSGGRERERARAERVREEIAPERLPVRGRDADGREVPAARREGRRGAVGLDRQPREERLQGVQPHGQCRRAIDRALDLGAGREPEEPRRAAQQPGRATGVDGAGCPAARESAQAPARVPQRAHPAHEKRKDRVAVRQVEAQPVRARERAQRRDRAPRLGDEAARVRVAVEACHEQLRGRLPGRHVAVLDPVRAVGEEHAAVLERLVPKSSHDAARLGRPGGEAREPLLEGGARLRAVGDDGARAHEQAEERRGREEPCRTRPVQPLHRVLRLRRAEPRRGFVAVAPVEPQRFRVTSRALGGLRQVKEGLGRARLFGAAPGARGVLGAGGFSLRDAGEAFVARGPRGIGAEGAVQGVLGLLPLRAPLVDRRRELGRLRESRVELAGLVEQRERRRERGRIAARNVNLGLAPAIDRGGGRLLGHRSRRRRRGFRSPLDPARQRLAQRLRLFALLRGGFREVAVEPLLGLRRVPVLRPALRREAQRRAKVRPQGDGAVEQRERFVLGAAVRLRPEQVREQRQGLGAVGLDRERVATGLDRGGRAAGARLEGGQSEQRLDVRRFELERRAERLPRLARAPRRERALAVGQGEPRFDGRSRGGERDCAGLFLELELPHPRGDPVGRFTA